ncbi:hypothetical protein N658DRAFT_115224 [Parathielavia hyrcaniae]|uniref:Uncharacterized protein n=1 Tax=Parathielavia hyrcaniae TaxID=113614 RepID=A0AAN6Q849_9PEZI|nr:hypothetical protein N658DRAFT_115224 [Parathielavia hyrcaniae]
MFRSGRQVVIIPAHMLYNAPPWADNHSMRPEPREGCSARRQPARVAGSKLGSMGNSSSCSLEAAIVVRFRSIKTDLQPTRLNTLRAPSSVHRHWSVSHLQRGISIHLHHIIRLSRESFLRTAVCSSVAAKSPSGTNNHDLNRHVCLGAISWRRRESGTEHRLCMEYFVQTRRLSLKGTHLKA